METGWLYLISETICSFHTRWLYVIKNQHIPEGKFRCPQVETDDQLHSIQATELHHSGVLPPTQEVEEWCARGVPQPLRMRNAVLDADD